MDSSDYRVLLKMRKRFYFMRGCLLFTVFMLFFAGSPYNEQGNKNLSRTVSSQLGIQDAGVMAGLDDFIEKFKSKPPKGMAFIPAGTFMMGSEHGSSDGKPTHSVTLGPFFIDKFEVTQKEFEFETADFGLVDNFNAYIVHIIHTITIRLAKKL